MKRTIKILVVAAVTLVVMMTATQPTKLPSLLLMVPFILMFGILTCLLALIFSKHTGALTAKSVRMGAVGASLPILLLVLQSIGQLTIKDVFIILLLFGLAYFYVARISYSARLVK